MFSTPSRRRRGIISTSALALLATPLALVAAPAQAADPVDVQVIGTNDFHGRLINDGRAIPGAAEYAGALNSLRADNPNTVFAAAGDIIGATTFESFINHDKPTIDVMNQMDLDVSATGNHEFDQGYDDLVNRVMAPYDASTNPYGGAEWQYIAANVDEPGGADLIPPTWTEDVAGVTVGFVGAVTEDLPSLVSPGGIEGLTVTDIVDSTNDAAADLTAAGADVVVLLVHEGAPGTDCDTMDEPSTTWGQIVTGVGSDVDAIVSGHTHLQYDCEFPVDGLDFPRPVVSAGQYGAFLDKVVFTVDPDDGAIGGVSHSTVDVFNGGFTPDPDVQAIVDQAVADAEEPGSVVLGDLDGALRRAVQPGDAGPVENRGGESSLGNLVAEVQRWATRTDERGNAQIAFMNPGGLREDMEAGELTYKEAAVVQPFANTLVNMDMNRRQIKKALEQQWQRDGDGNVPSRPYLALGTSSAFQFTYDTSRPEGHRITGMYLHNRPLRMGRTYSVTVNSFLASGGDNFRVFGNVADQRDAGITDLSAMVDYMAAKTSSSPLEPSYSQHAVGVRLPKGKRVARGKRIRLKLSSLVMTATSDVKDRVVRVKLGKKVRGVSRIDRALVQCKLEGTPYGCDRTGTATVRVKIPRKAKPGKHYLRVVGNRTGTSVKVPIRITRH